MDGAFSVQPSLYLHLNISAVIFICHVEVFKFLCPDQSEGVHCFLKTYNPEIYGMKYADEDSPRFETEQCRVLGTIFKEDRSWKIRA